MKKYLVVFEHQNIITEPHFNICGYYEEILDISGNVITIPLSKDYGTTKYTINTFYIPKNRNEVYIGSFGMLFDTEEEAKKLSVEKIKEILSTICPYERQIEKLLVYYKFNVKKDYSKGFIITDYDNIFNFKHYIDVDKDAQINSKECIIKTYENYCNIFDKKIEKCKKEYEEKINSILKEKDKVKQLVESIIGE